MSRFPFSDPTDTLAGTNYRKGGPDKPTGIVLYFKHVPSGLSAEFKAFITEYDDGFSQEWNSKEVWGRMDDIRTYKNTKRVISVSWTVPSHSREEAEDNFNEVSKMVNMQYPNYEELRTDQKGNFADAPNVILDVNQIKNSVLSIENEAEQSLIELGPIKQSIENIERYILSSAKESEKFPVPNLQQVNLLSSPPIIQMKFMNWISDSNDDGLYGTLDGFHFKPVLEEGVFLKNGKLIPMTCECSVQFTVIHTDKLGWDDNKQKRTTGFPYEPKTSKTGEE